MTKSSPFEAVHEQLGANFAEYEGWRIPSDYGDPDAETNAVSQSSAAFDLSSFGRIQIKGSSADGVIAAITDGAEIAQGQWIWCNSYRIGKTDKGYLLLAQPSERFQLLSELEKEASKGVTIKDITENTAMLGIYGPSSVQALNNILPFDLSDIEPNSVRNLNIFMMPLTLIRGSWLDADGLELICPLMAASMAGGAIAKYHKRENIVPSGMQSLQFWIDEHKKSKNN